MSETKHTPWKAITDEYGARVYFGARSGGVMLAPDTPNCNANARLIAAAPDMLAALKGLLAPEPGGVLCGSELIAAARAAIAKAEHGEP